MSTVIPASPQAVASTDPPVPSPAPAPAPVPAPDGPSPASDGRSWLTRVRLGRPNRLTTQGDGTSSPNGRRWKVFGGFRLSEELENKGSVARDHLASERTFLAWLRTSLGFVSLGIAVAQLFKIPDIVSGPSKKGPGRARDSKLVEALELQLAFGPGASGTSISDGESITDILFLVSQRLGLDMDSLSSLLRPSANSDLSISSLDEPSRRKMLYTLLSLVRADMEADQGESWTRLQTMQKIGKPLGATCILLGALCLLLGARRYFVVQSRLVQGTYLPSRVEVSAVSLLLGALMCAAFGVIVGTKVTSG